MLGHKFRYGKRGRASRTTPALPSPANVIGPPCCAALPTHARHSPVTPSARVSMHIYPLSREERQIRPSPHHPSSRSSLPLPVRVMTKDYRRLWEDVVVSGKSDEAKVDRTLTEIVMEKEGRAFISDLDRAQAGLCIEMLNRVGFNRRLRRYFAF